MVKLRVLDANDEETIISVTSELADVLCVFVAEEGQQIVNDEIDKEIIAELRRYLGP